ncbi:hypothetical protein BDV98DRAFT_653070 [Pterulicium gracile]|uniref:Protein CPL1-like domain-containing protein n=1 Tax=Pterulicium gracile TaxID=1884261 RepID=A0A5C3R198_9AGAR|nr:hypothetical protein BDV98DRAFT_653070 [Pterula gracilis]
MSVITRFSVLFVLLSLAGSITAANTSRAFNSPVDLEARHGGGGGDKHGNNGRDCKGNEFWYKKKNCCLPHGGPPSPPPPPPSGSDCPPKGFYWNKGQGCCVPDHEEEDDSPPPQCRRGWRWSPHQFKCDHDDEPTPPSNPPPKPSKGPGDHGGKDNDNHGGRPEGQHGGGGHGGRDGHGYHKRSLKSRSAALCPSGMEACSIGAANNASGDYECIETAYDLRNCGGCVLLGEGQDCLALPGTRSVGCEQGTCTVYTCAQGFKLTAQGTCIAI